MILHLAATPDHEAPSQVLVTVESPTGYLQPFEDGDPVATHMAIADQEGRTGKRRQARTDEPRSLVVHTFGFARAGKSFVIWVVPVDPFAGNRRCQRARRILLVEQG